MPNSCRNVPVGGPIVGIGVKPNPTEALYNAGVIWIGYGVVQKINRAGTIGTYVYAWIDVAPAASGLNAEQVQTLIDASNREIQSRIVRLDQLTTDIELVPHSGWVNVTDIVIAGMSLAPLAAFTTDADVVAALQYRTSVTALSAGRYVPIMRIPKGNNINSYRLARTGSSTDPIHGVFHGGGFTRGAYDYVFYAGSLELEANDSLQVQSVGTTYTTLYHGSIPGLNAAIHEALPPFFGITPVPAGMAGGTSATDYPDYIDIVFTEKITNKTITGVSVLLSGSALILSSSTPLSNINDANELQGALRFEINGAAKIGLSSTVSRNSLLYLSGQVTITFSDSTTRIHDFCISCPEQRFQEVASSDCSGRKRSSASNKF